MVPLIYSKT